MNTDIPIVKLADETPLPCSIQAPDGGICGQPATVAYARLLAPASPWAVPGLWELQPVCQDCAAAAAAIQQDAATPPASTATHRRRSKWDRFQEETTP